MKRLLTALLIAPIRLYQRFISPARYGDILLDQWPMAPQRYRVSD